MEYYDLLDKIHRAPTQDINCLVPDSA